MSLRQRPLSPHLQIYKPSFTMAMSMAHRLTGILFYLFFPFLCLGLVCLAMGEGTFLWVSSFFGSLVGRFVLLALTWVLIHHTLGGIRHLIWDVGCGFSLPSVERMARLTLLGSLIITGLVGFFCYL